MRFFKKLFMVSLLCFIALTCIGFMLPEQYSIEKEIKINAPNNLVFDELNNLMNWQHWSPWKEDVKDKKIEFSLVAIGEGAWQKWQSKSYGVGKLNIKRVTQSKMILYELIFENYNLRSTGEFYLEEISPEITHLKWKDTYLAGNNIFFRYFGLLSNAFLGSEFEQSLLNLKYSIEEKKVKYD